MALLLAFLLGCREPDDPVRADTAALPDDPDAPCVPETEVADWDCDGYRSESFGGYDCDDADPTVHPGATDIPCDGVDRDCNTYLAETTVPWYPDADGDGYGVTAAETFSCTQPEGHVSVSGDCDDSDASVHPGASDPCDGVDHDCDGASERDADGDGQRACAGDCDDSHPDVFAGAAEACDGLDADCDGLEEADRDGDGYWTCDGDCNDWRNGVHPGAPETCDGLDDDCDGVLAAEEWDLDRDGALACAGDCDDLSPSARAGAVEICDDGRDNDCAGDGDADCASVCDIAVPNDYASIQEAIDAAASGDTICVGEGTWYENLDFGGAEIAVVGVAGAAGTVLDGGGAGVVAFVHGEGPAAVLRGFTVTNGGYDGPHTGGIHVEDASPTLLDLVVTGNVSSGGAGLTVIGGAPTVERVEISDNEAAWWWCYWYYGYGGGVYLQNSDAILEDVTIAGNVAGWMGGGLYVGGDSSASVSHARIEGNTALDWLSSYGGGVHVAGGVPRFDQIVVSDNVSYVYGGGISVAGGSPSFSNAVVADNADDGVYVVGDGLAGLAGVIVTGNDVGIAVASSGTRIQLEYCDVWGNASDYAGLADPTGADGNVSVDPELLSGGQLDATSPLIDAGDPTLTDPDGSVSDIGAFGGPRAAGWDADGDGFSAWWLPGPYDAATSPGADCDDQDPSVYPGSGC